MRCDAVGLAIGIRPFRPPTPTPTIVLPQQPSPEPFKPTEPQSCKHHQSIKELNVFLVIVSSTSSERH